MNIQFEKASAHHIETIFGWLAATYIQAFWDNTQAHKDDILNFIGGRTQPSSYADGKYVYWIASDTGHPFAMFMTIQSTAEDHVNDIKLIHLSKTGHSYGLEYMIGDQAYFGKGYGAKTLSEFLIFFRREFDPKADTFLIDPASDNPRAKHVYMKAGFEHVADFIMSGDVSGAGKPHHLLIKRFALDVQLMPATLADYPTIQNMARFYVYDRTAYMGWECPENGLFECIDFKHYLENPVEKAFLIKVANEIAGFILLDKMILLEPVDGPASHSVKSEGWNMGEFFVLAKFQGKGIASAVAMQIFKKYPGKWSVAVMPENIRAVKFWRKIISEVSQENYTEIFKTADELKSVENPDPYAMNIFSFDTKKLGKVIEERNILVRLATSVDVEHMVAMSYQKRRDYEKAQPQFWKWAGVDAEALQAKWFAELITRDDHVILVATESHEKIIGFIIGRLMPAPEVYNPGGLTLMIDDYCIEHEVLWESVGTKLIDEIKFIAKFKQAVQMLVVCGAHDKAKGQFLKNRALTVASDWYVGSIL